MSGEHHDPLSDSERTALRALSYSTAPRELEAHIVAALKSRGLIRTRKGGLLMKLSLAAGALAVVVLAFAAGVTVSKKAQPVADVSADHQYMLLLYMNTAEQPENPPEMSDAEYAAAVDEYRQWGARMREEGRLVGAEKLKDDAFILLAGGRTRQGPAEGRVLEGYFLIRAGSLEEARELAQTHPHLKYGGEVEIRPLDLHD